jgi:hypothetical protein
VQAAFGWSDARGHYFVIRGKQYSGAESLLSESATLATFHFRMKERFLYHHGLSDGWRHQIRFEGTPVLGESRASAVCVGGARAGPSDEYATPRDYAVGSLFDEMTRRGLRGSTFVMRSRGSRTRNRTKRCERPSATLTRSPKPCNASGRTIGSIPVASIVTM